MDLPLTLKLKTAKEKLITKVGHSLNTGLLSNSLSSRALTDRMEVIRMSDAGERDGFKKAHADDPDFVPPGSLDGTQGEGDLQNWD